MSSRYTPWLTRFGVVALGLGLLAWTLLLPRLGWVDRLWSWPPLPDRSTAGQIHAAFAIDTAPVLVYAVLLGCAFWAVRRQFSHLAAALILGSMLSFGAAITLGEVMGRARPHSEWDYLITRIGNSYPSPHLVAITAAAVLLLTFVRVSRRSWGGVAMMTFLMPVLVLAVSVNRLALGANYLTDVIGGILLGGLTATSALAICGVHVPIGRATSTEKLAAIIYNPIKVVDFSVLKDLVERRFSEAGWEPPIWLPTSPKDPGRGMAKEACRAEPDLILIAGGDGTVRVVCGELSGCEIPVAILPSGTGNLLARNIGIPLDINSAIDVAMGEHRSPIDVLQVDVPDKPTDYAMVMCGIGTDAAVINDTNESLKRQIGFVAYVLAALNHIKTTPVTTHITIDDKEPIVREASITMVCNVGSLYPGLTILPQAVASDGLLDVLIASPQNQAELTQLAAAVLSNSKPPSTLDQTTGKSVVIEVAQEQLYELDGDIGGKTKRIEFQIIPGAIQLQVPTSAALQPPAGSE